MVVAPESKCHASLRSTSRKFRGERYFNSSQANNQKTIEKRMPLYTGRVTGF